MKFTYNWLKDFVDVKLAPEALAERLTMAGLEVESVTPVGGDFVFEVEVTSNRPDWLSVAGIAREVAALTDKGMKPPAYQKIIPPRSKRETERFAIQIEDKKDCPLYTARIIREVRVEASPAWIKERLEMVGCRSVNNVVDSTNYIMFTWGQPLHAFDLEALSTDTIVVRRATPAEKITTIDGEQKLLSPEIMVIADKRRPVAVAGVMGGLDTEVHVGTRTVLLEAAIFNPVVVRRGRRILGIQSESSYRFERGVDPSCVDFNSRQAAALIEQYACGQTTLAKSSSPPDTKKKFIHFDIEQGARVLGLAVLPPTKVKTILTHLGFGVRVSAKDNFSIEVPAYRPDVNLPEDLIEEIARIIGYEHIPETLPSVKPQVFSDQRRPLVAKTKNILVGLGLQEVITHSLVSKADLAGFSGMGAGEPVEVENPLSQEQAILRPSLLPSLLRAVAYNLNQRQSPVTIFEVSDVFSSDEKTGVSEELHLGLALCGTKSLYVAQGLLKDDLGLLHAKGIIETLCVRLGVKGLSWIPRDASTIEIFTGEEKIGTVVDIPEGVLERLDIKNRRASAAEIYLEKVFAAGTTTKKFTSLPLYPGISRDISVVLAEDIPVGEILTAIRDTGGKLLEQVTVVDYYKGKQIAAGSKGLTLSCLYRSPARTLTEEEVVPVHARVLNTLVEKFHAAIR
jgi:phenylalanyl-tRNA synthetase beta chain